jgi:hypothetical protein
MIYSNDQWISVGAQQSAPYFSPNNFACGSVRYNGTLQCIEVYDGISWLKLTEHVNISMSPKASDLLDWASKKREEEKLYESDPRLKDLYEKLQLMTALVRKEKLNQVE